jgi:hypothetical protein
MLPRVQPVRLRQEAAARMTPLVFFDRANTAKASNKLLRSFSLKQQHRIIGFLWVTWPFNHAPRRPGAGGVQASRVGPCTPQC